MAGESPISHSREWRVVRLGDIALKIGSGATPLGGEEAYLPIRSKFALVRSQNVFDRRFDETGLAFISDAQADRLKGVNLQEGDLLLNITGDGTTFARSCAEGADTTLRAALQMTRDGAGSTITGWDVDQDSVSEHDRRHASLRQYLVAGAANIRDVAHSIRPLLEGFLRVACPEHFPPGALLGPFRGLCEQRVGTQREILSAQSIQELRDLTEYANRFHHDTNPAWETEVINDGELRGFVARALSFARR